MPSQNCCKWGYWDIVWSHNHILCLVRRMEKSMSIDFYLELLFFLQMFLNFFVLYWTSWIMLPNSKFLKPRFDPGTWGFFVYFFVRGFSAVKREKSSAKFSLVTLATSFRSPCFYRWKAEAQIKLTPGGFVSWQHHGVLSLHVSPRAKPLLSDRGCARGGSGCTPGRISHGKGC